MCFHSENSVLLGVREGSAVSESVGIFGNLFYFDILSITFRLLTSASTLLSYFTHLSSTLVSYSLVMYAAVKHLFPIGHAKLRPELC